MHVWSRRVDGGRKLDVAVDVGSKREKLQKSEPTLAFEKEALGAFGGVSQLPSIMGSSSVSVRTIPNPGSME